MSTYLPYVVSIIVAIISGLFSYMQASKKELLKEIDLNMIKRKEKSGYKMTRFSFLNKDRSCFEMGEKIVFSLSVYAQKECKNACIRGMIYYSDDTPVCMASSKSGELSLEVGENEIEGIVDIGGLAPGTYRIKLALYCVNEFGAEAHLDVVDKAIYFEVEDNNLINNMEWKHQWWGHVSLNNIEIKK